MGLRIGPSMPSTKEQRRRRDEQRNGSRKYSQEWEKDPFGCLPTQMTSQSHPPSKTHKSAVTTRTGCQGDTLCLSIKGAVCEDYNDLENKQCEHWHPRGTEQKKKKKQKQTLWPRPNAINVLRTEVCHRIQWEAQTQNQAHCWNRLNLIKPKECSSEGETNNTELFCKCAINHEEVAASPSMAPTANCSVLILDHR